MTPSTDILRLIEIMARLRDPEGGCPWDLQQSFETIVPHTIEEAYEVAETIAGGDLMELRDELGDLLFQVVFYAQLAREQGAFDFNDVVHAISEKMLRRHPHVFGEAEIRDEKEQRIAWERHKAAERAGKAETGPPSQLDGVAHALPALTRAHKLQRRAAEVGFDWPEISGTIDKIREELDEVSAEVELGFEEGRIEEEVGDLLFACVNLARHAGVDAETALRKANQKFERRFRGVEQDLTGLGKALADADLGEMDAAWERVKGLEKG